MAVTCVGRFSESTGTSLWPVREPFAPRIEHLPLGDECRAQRKVHIRCASQCSASTNILQVIMTPKALLCDKEMLAHSGHCLSDALLNKLDALIIYS